ncbi:hypothetical protein ACJVC5_08260 [Peredibacter sp. HCB2-198]|uniref:hypothetical protein n=1 Tax=Peredibacter sp. HCB2-198 TaxID=3383025 RepID=UPI0038B494A4
MKTITFFLACAVVLPTYAASFNPLQKLQESRALYAEVQVVIHENQAKIEAFKSEALGAEEEVRSFNLNHPALKETLATCANLMNAKMEETGKELSNRNESEARASLKTLTEIEESVKRYIDAEECSKCDPELREAAMNKYQERVLTLMKELKPSQYASRDVNDLVDRHLSRKFCKFNKYFVYEDDKITKGELDHIGCTYHDSLAPAEILSGRYTESLLYIAKNAPVKVVRNSKRNGEPSSKFTGKTVRLTLTYDKSVITGLDNIRFPVDGNPIWVIQDEM